MAERSHEWMCLCSVLLLLIFIAANSASYRWLAYSFFRQPVFFSLRPSWSSSLQIHSRKQTTKQTERQLIYLRTHDGHPVIRDDIYESSSLIMLFKQINVWQNILHMPWFLRLFPLESWMNWSALRFSRPTHSSCLAMSHRDGINRRAKTKQI